MMTTHTPVYLNLANRLENLPICALICSTPITVVLESLDQENTPQPHQRDFQKIRDANKLLYRNSGKSVSRYLHPDHHF